jgi:hypothetical protein
MSTGQRRSRKRKQFDDETFSLRLNSGIDREAKALQVLKNYMNKVNPTDGKKYTSRHVLTEALLALDTRGMPEETPIDVHEMADQLSDALEQVQDVELIARRLQTALNHVEQLAAKLETMGVQKPRREAKKQDEDDSPNMSFMRNLAKSAMRRDEEQK